ncbi:MAG TPA: DUF6036 family nucleotidyltransferase [Planctomycetota bacterium]|nr:DUF6036 family nucleotidyltransferase [Planctomycetota bacterium]
MKAELFSKDAQEFLCQLAKHAVRYVLIGGIAVIHHGYARLTGDVDFLYDRSPQNVQRLWAALLEFWQGSVPSVGNAAELEDPDLVLQFGRPPNRIDLIASLRAVSFADAWQNRIGEQITVNGASVPIWILGLADLRRAKRDAGRPKDLDDLDHLPS